MNGGAHVTFAGGGIVLPAREPYDRELVVEHVAERVRRTGVLCLAVHGRTWIVRRIDRIVFKTERGHGPAFWITTIIAQVVLGILASIIVMWFSRRRESFAPTPAAPAWQGATT